jgi:Pyridoxamine 5'-phosphate oxidase
MPKLTPEEIDDHLANRSWLVRVGTISHTSGAPRIAPARYLYHQRELLITARERSAWLEDIRHDPRVCAIVDSDYYPLRKVTIQGNAEIRFEPGEDDEWREFRAPKLDPTHVPVALDDGREEWAWHQAYNDMTWTEPRALVVVPLEGSVVTSWRMPLAGERLEEVWSRRYRHATRHRYVVRSVSEVTLPPPATVRVVTEAPINPDSPYVLPWQN